MSEVDKNLYAIQCMYLHGCVFSSTMQEAIALGGADGNYDIAEHQDLYMKKLYQLGFGEYPNVMRLMDFMDMFTKIVAEGVDINVIIENKLNKQPKGFASWIDDALVDKLPYNELVKLREQICSGKKVSESTAVSHKYPYASVISPYGVQRMSEWGLDDVPPCNKN